MTKEQLQLMINKDSPKITENNVDEVLAINPALYSKYLTLLLEENKELRDLKAKLTHTYLNLKEYFRGLKDLNDPMVKERGQFNKRILEKEVEMYIECDMDYIAPKEKYDDQKEIVNAIRDFLDQLKFRPNNAKTFCDWKRFIHGV